MRSFTKQPSERFPFAIEFAGKLPAGDSLASGIFLAANLKIALTTTLAAAAAVGDTTVSLPVDPKAGAILIIGDGSSAREEAQVLSVAGSGPYTATLTAPLEQAHASAVAVQYLPGVSTIFQSSVATISGTQAIAEIKGGQHGMDYRLTLLATLTSGNKLEEDFTLSVVNR